MNDYENAAACLETIPAGESAEIQEITELMVRLLEQRYTGQAPVLRAVHPKSHGCVRASFEVDKGIPRELQVGLFSNPGSRYQSVIRFSNAAALVGPDVLPQVDENGKQVFSHGSRGMAIKVRGVTGKVAMPDGEPDAQDFLMVNFPVFPFANVHDYLELTRAQIQHDKDPRALLQAFAAAIAIDAEGQQRAKRAAEISRAIQTISMASPLQSSYFSAAPFLFGADRVMKFAVVPVNPPDDPFPEAPTEAYLRDVLAKQLASRGADFDFCVQIRDATDDLAIEDVTVEWDPTQTPLQKVASIHIPSQEFSSPDAIDACESLFFTPWHALWEHLPLGGINRLRKAAYIASFRRRTQAVDAKPPVTTCPS